MSQTLEYDAPYIGIYISNPFPLFDFGTTNTLVTLGKSEDIYLCTGIIDSPAMPWLCFSKKPVAGRPLVYLLQAHEAATITLCVRGEEMEDSYIEALRAMYL